MIAGALARFVEQGWVNLVGGCCGTTPAHIRALADGWSRAGSRARPATPREHAVSGIELPRDATDDNRPVIVGERTNVIGSASSRS